MTDTRQWPGVDGAPVNSATDGAYVEQQIGIVQGDAIFHNETIYQVNPGDPPAKRFQVACAHLDGGNSRVAESMLRTLLDEGHKSTEYAYYYGLSVVSDRSLNQFGSAELNGFTFAMTTAHLFPADEWTLALDMVATLMDAVSSQDLATQPDPAVLKSVMESFRDLPARRQVELTRHLDLIINGAVQDVLEAVGAEAIADVRMDRDRADRAWKFFEADPAPPRETEWIGPGVDTVSWVKLVLGGIGLVLGIVGVLGAPNGASGALGVALVIAGMVVAGHFGVERDAMVDRRRCEATRYGESVFGLPALRPSGSSLSGWFVGGISRLVDARFAFKKPTKDAETWDSDLVGVRHALKLRLIQVYQDPEVRPAKLNWLIRWHVDRIVEQWKADTLFDYRTTLVVSPMTTAMYWAGLVLAAFGALACGSAGAILVAAGGYFALHGGIDVLVHRSRVAEEQAEFDREFEELQGVHDRWVRTLMDRPTDAEMNRWLDFDKAHIKAMAMSRFTLRNRDIVTHVILTQGAPTAMRARVVHGAPRYSEYIVLVFLLTEAGVREVEMTLNFCTGAVHSERRTSFRYESLTSATVFEAGVRFAGNKRMVVKFDDQVLLTDDKAALVLARAFRLVIGPGEDITVVVENFDGLADTDVENQEELQHLALESAGVGSALHTLEAVAAEGREWITRERERRTRRWLDWRRGAPGAPHELGAATLGIEPPSTEDRWI